MLKRWLLVMLVLMIPLAPVWANQGEADQLAQDEKLCKEIANDLEKLYEATKEKYVSKDYRILRPRLTSYVKDFFEDKPNEVMKAYYPKVQKNYQDMLAIVAKKDLKEKIQSEINWIEKELSGNCEDVNLIGYVPNSRRVKNEVLFGDIELYREGLEGSQGDKLDDLLGEIRSDYKKINIVSIEYNLARKDVYDEFMRFSDRKINYKYIEDDLKNPFIKIATKMKDNVYAKDKSSLAAQQVIIDAAFKKYNEAKIAFDKYDGDDVQKEQQLFLQKKAQYRAWLNAKAVTLDQLRLNELQKMQTILRQNLMKKGSYNVNNAEIFHLLSLPESDYKSHLENYLDNKYYADLIKKFNFYAKFSIDTGYRSYRTNVLILVFAFMALFLFVLYNIRNKKDALFIRRIPGLDAIDDAVGRATEMGKPVIFNSGLGGISNPQTIASMLILNKVAKKVAEFKAEIIYPAYDPIVLQVAEEMIASGFLDAGVPEEHKKENCFFLVQNQFAFAAGLSGIVARTKPATCLHFGNYAAESLLISEAGYAAGAIQVAGTVDASQLPFFIAACDYTLIGEELYAAAAYLSRDPQIMSNLKLSDYGKLVLGLLFIISTIMLTINSEWTWLYDLFVTH